VYPDDGHVQHEVINIRRKHVYRSVKTGHNDVVFKITLRQILDAALVHHQFQILADTISSTLKRKGEGEDGLDESARQMIMADVERIGKLEDFGHEILLVYLRQGFCIWLVMSKFKNHCSKTKTNAQPKAVCTRYGRSFRGCSTISKDWVVDALRSRALESGF